MAIKFDRIKEGDILFDCRRTKMGNTTMSEWSMWKVKIISVDVEAKTAIVSWNGNPPQKWHRRQLESLSRNEPKAHRDQSARRKTGSWI